VPQRFSTAAPQFSSVSVFQRFSFSAPQFRSFSASQDFSFSESPPATRPVSLVAAIAHNPRRNF
jgi:hypothetical protein